MIPKIQADIKSVCPTLERDVPVVIVENNKEATLTAQRGGPDCFKKLFETIEAVANLHPHSPFLAKYPCSKCGALLTKAQANDLCDKNRYHEGPVELTLHNRGFEFFLVNKCRTCRGRDFQPGCRTKPREFNFL
jgi:hypothetical protein